MAVAGKITLSILSFYAGYQTENVGNCTEKINNQSPKMISPFQESGNFYQIQFFFFTSGDLLITGENMNEQI